MDPSSSPEPPDVIPYQKNRTLDRVPGYAVGLQLRLDSGDRVYVALSTTDLTLYFENNLALHYDLEARLTRIAEPHQYWRRSLSHHGLHTAKLTAAEGGGLTRTALDAEQADALVAQAHGAVAQVDDQLRAGATIEVGKPDPAAARAQIEPLLARAAAFDVAAARSSAAEFARIYGRVAVLPSDQYNAFVLQATEGCGFGGCLFCELYQGVRYHAKTPEEFRQHVRDAVKFHGESLRARRTIFLGEANALNAPQRTLVDNLRFLHDQFAFPRPDEQHVPATWWLGDPTHFEGIATFLDVFTGDSRSPMDYTELRRLGLRRVYIGMETGSDVLLEWLRKPARAELIRRTITELKQGGIGVGVILLLGAGGQEFYEWHVRETVEVLNQLPLGRGDYLYFSPLVIYPGGPYDARVQSAGIQCLTAVQMRGQEAELRAGLKFDPRRGQPYLARYELETFVY